MLEDDCSKQPDFQALGLKIVTDVKEADLVVDVTLPFLSWTWTYVVTHQASNTQLANGKIRRSPPVSRLETGEGYGPRNCKRCERPGSNSPQAQRWQETDRGIRRFSDCLFLSVSLLIASVANPSVLIIQKLW